MTAVNNIGVLICGHGGSEAGTVREFMALAGDVALRLPQYQVASGFLELATPTIEEGLEKLRQAGCATILAIPGTLFSGGHAMQDIPVILRKFAARNRDVKITYGSAFDVHPDFVNAARARIEAAIEDAGKLIAPEKTALLIAGRGAADARVLASMQSIARQIQSEMKFSRVETAYAGIAQPLVPEALLRAAEQAYERVIIAPYFLFTGKLVQRIYAETDAIAGLYPHVDFLKTGYLNNHPCVIDGFVAQIMETSMTGTLLHG